MRIERWETDKVITIPCSEIRYLCLHHPRARLRSAQRGPAPPIELLLDGLKNSKK